MNSGYLFLNVWLICTFLYELQAASWPLLTASLMRACPLRMVSRLVSSETAIDIAATAGSGMDAVMDEDVMADGTKE